MPSMGASSAPTSRKGREARERASLSSSVLRKEGLLGRRSEEKDTMRAVGPSHRTPLTMSLWAPARDWRQSLGWTESGAGGQGEAQAAGKQGMQAAAEHRCVAESCD